MQPAQRTYTVRNFSRALVLDLDYSFPLAGWTVGRG